MHLNKLSRLFTRKRLSACISRYFQNGFSPPHKIECLEQLVTLLERNTIYFDKKLLVINKPYGLMKETPRNKTSTPPNFVKLNPAVASLEEFSLEDTIPFLCEKFNIPKLTVIKCPDRYMSGIAILASTDQAIDNFNKCIRRARSNFIFPKYQAVCVGTPKMRDLSQKLGIVMEVRKEYRAEIDRFKEKKIIFVNSWSANDVKKHHVTLLRIQHKVLSSTPDYSASLVEVMSSWNRAHCVRTYLAAQLLTPVLGDHVHSSRVKYVFDKPMMGPVWSLDPPMQYLPKNLKDKLKIRRKNEELTIPEHIHLSQLVLPAYHKDKRDLVLTSPITSSAVHQYALDILGLVPPEVHEETTQREFGQNG